MKVCVTISIDQSVLEEIDRKKGRYSRSQFIEDVLFWVLSASEENEEVGVGYA